jgi:superfamily II DNA/RNA helicase
MGFFFFLCYISLSCDILLNTKFLSLNVSDMLNFLGADNLSMFLFQIYSAGFSSPTPIQAQTWPIALQSRDIVAIAKTGSGKTLGYLIPAFILLRHCHNDSRNGPTVLVLAPTRELATQIQDEVMKFGRSSGISCTVSSKCSYLNLIIQLKLVLFLFALDFWFTS